MHRLATFTLTSSYQKLGTLLNSVSGAFSSRQFRSGAFRCTAASTSDIRISIVESTASTGNDSLSNLLDQGEYFAVGEIDLNQVWAKGDGGAATLEFEGQE